jgi:hypothetical protein
MEIDQHRSPTVIFSLSRKKKGFCLKFEECFMHLTWDVVFGTEEKHFGTS